MNKPVITVVGFKSSLRADSGGLARPQPFMPAKRGFDRKCQLFFPQMAADFVVAGEQLVCAAARAYSR
jgi:hypothetical protein